MHSNYISLVIVQPIIPVWLQLKIVVCWEICIHRWNCNSHITDSRRHIQILPVSFNPVAKRKADYLYRNIFHMIRFIHSAMYECNVQLSGSLRTFWYVSCPDYVLWERYFCNVIFDLWNWIHNIKILTSRVGFSSMPALQNLFCLVTHVH